ncbi:MAG: hypothetical protein NT094_01435 [Candidatus Staskawiczbacteria bacterium]|nr:hypothetical protein [Candidatus Staskawiczbacteria bacterium]
MENLDNKTKEKIKEMLEWALEPIQVKVIGFKNSYEVTHRSKMGDEPWKEWKEKLYWVELEKNEKKFLETISELHLRKSIMDAVWVLCHDLCYSSDISEKEKGDILDRLWSKEFLELNNNK